MAVDEFSLFKTEHGRRMIDLGDDPSSMRRIAEHLEDFAQLRPDGHTLTFAWMLRRIADLTERVNELERITR